MSCENNCPDCKCKEDAPEPTRRGFLCLAVGVINGIVGIAVIGPVLGFIGAPLFGKARGKWVKVLPLAEIMDGETKDVSYSMTVHDGYQTVEHKYSAFLQRKGDQITAYDPTCTHLGCRIKYQSKKGRYFCPCHGGVFDDAGNVVSGPPPKSLRQFKTKIEDAHVWLHREV
jgi:Rieske Fe-S protein